jgi:hypothetical protein
MRDARRGQRPSHAAHGLDAPGARRARWVGVHTLRVLRHARALRSVRAGWQPVPFAYTPRAKGSATGPGRARPALRMRGARAGDEPLPAGAGIHPFAYTAHVKGLGCYPPGRGACPAGTDCCPARPTRIPSRMPRTRRGRAATRRGQGCTRRGHAMRGRWRSPPAAFVSRRRGLSPSGFVARETAPIQGHRFDFSDLICG